MSQLTSAVPQILLVDDEQQSLEAAAFILHSEGYSRIMTCNDSTCVIDLCRNNQFSIVLMDISMPHISGIDLLPGVKEECPGALVIMLTGANDVETAVLCMKNGAFDYLLKPIDRERLVAAVNHAAEYRELEKENTALGEQLLGTGNVLSEVFKPIITQNGVMHGIFKYIQAIALSSIPVLIEGETGTGKELIAESIHKCSGRSGEFVAVNVAGIDDNLFSDMLFGHVKGAFTGANADRKGVIEQASQGTLFLDEIGDLSMESQIKLLRILQDRKYYPVGTDTPKPSNARIIVATNCNLSDMQRCGKFRKDLFYRLQTHHIKVPPLRERKEDIALLVDLFLDAAATEYCKKKPFVPRELFDVLGVYDFPGNIRELQGMVYDAVSRHSGGIMSINVFREKIGERIYPDSDDFMVERESELDSDEIIQFKGQLPTLKTMEELLIMRALKAANGNQSVAADILGISRRALNNRLMRANTQQSAQLSV